MKEVTFKELDNGAMFNIGRATCIKVSRNKYVGPCGSTKLIDTDRLVRISECALYHKLFDYAYTFGT